MNYKDMSYRKGYNETLKELNAPKTINRYDWTGLNLEEELIVPESLYRGKVDALIVCMHIHEVKI